MIKLLLYNKIKFEIYKNKANPQTIKLKSITATRFCIMLNPNLHKPTHLIDMSLGFLWGEVLINIQLNFR